MNRAAAGGSGVKQKSAPLPTPLFYFFLVMAAASAVRFWNLGELRSYDIDEAHMLLLSQGPLSGLIERLRLDAYPPLYFVLLRFWTAAFGVSEFAVRSLSALFGLAAVALVYLRGRLLMGERAALLAAFILAVAPLHVFYSREARMYALLCLLGLIALFCLLEALKPSGRRAPWIGLGAALLAAFYTHTFGAFYTAAAGACLFAVREPARRRSLLLTVGAVFFCALPWAPVLLSQAGTGGESWMEPFFRQLPPWAAIPRSLEALGAGGRYPPMNYGLGAGDSLWPLAWAFYGVLLVFGFRSRDAAFPEKIALAAFLFIPLLIPWVYSLAFRPVYVVGRYDVIAQGAFIMIAGLGVSAAPAQARGGVVAACCFFSAMSLHALFTKTPKLIAPERAALISSMEAGSDLVLVTDLLAEPMRAEFLKRGKPVEVRAFPEEVNRHPAWVDHRRINEDGVRREAEALVRLLAGGARPVWFIPGGGDASSRALGGALERGMRFDPAGSNQELGVYRFLPGVPAEDAAKN